MHELILAGCATKPLGSYLKGLGAFRILAEQCAPDVMASWPAEALQLTTHLDRSSLEEFFVEQYQPTPIVSPWNGSSGFDDKAVPEIERIIESNNPRLDPYQDTIAEARGAAAAGRREGMSKQDVLLRCRATLPDAALPWLDAAVVLTDDRPAYPPLLGTGGNLGRLELSRNYMGHLALVLCLESRRGAPTPEHSRAWLRAALFDEGDPQLVQQSIAQFDPGAAGGANMAATGKAESVVNPWDYVLLLEGALLFASAVARRLGRDSGGTAAMPFTTRPTPVGYTSNAEEEPAKGEFWAPVWQRPVTLPELSYLLGEGRADWRGHQARTGLDFARAAASLGTDRGVHRFVRHTFVERLGQMTLAVPVGTVVVRDRPEVRVLGQLDDWLNRIRRTQPLPRGVTSALRRVDQALYAVASDGGTSLLQRTLTETARLHHAVSRSPAVRERVPPLTAARADDWVPRLDDGSDEFAVAAGLASAQDRDMSLRRLLTPVSVDPRGRLRWSDRTAPVAGLGTRPITEVLAAALERHAIDRSRGQRPSPDDTLDHVGHGLDLHFAFQRATPRYPILRSAGGQLEGRRLSQFLEGLLLLDWRVRDGVPAHRPSGSTSPAPITPAAALLLPFFDGRPLPRGAGRVLLRADPSWPRLLAAGRHAAVLDDALRRLRMAGFDVPPLQPQTAATGHDGPWLAVAALCRLRQRDAERLLEYVNPPEPE